MAVHIIENIKPMTKKEAVETIGLQSVDYTLPAQWFREISESFIRMGFEHAPELILSGTVWCYDDSTYGYPYPLTLSTYNWLVLHDERMSTTFTRGVFVCLRN